MAKILLVEDDNNLREIYEARLQAEGYDIISAQDGEEALVKAKQEKPDLVISDVMMPRISGFEMLDILRNTEGMKDMKVIMLTALGQAEDKTRADSLGADRYLVKSQVTLEDIVKAASELLSPAASTANSISGVATTTSDSGVTTGQITPNGVAAATVDTTTPGVAQPPVQAAPQAISATPTGAAGTPTVPTASPTVPPAPAVRVPAAMPGVSSSPAPATPTAQNTVPVTPAPSTEPTPVKPAAPVIPAASVTPPAAATAAPATSAPNAGTPPAAGAIAPQPSSTNLAEDNDKLIADAVRNLTASLGTPSTNTSTAAPTAGTATSTAQAPQTPKAPETASVTAAPSPNAKDTAAPSASTTTIAPEVDTSAASGQAPAAATEAAKEPAAAASAPEVPAQQQPKVSENANTPTPPAESTDTTQPSAPAPSQAASTADEQAAMQAQIDDFIKQQNATATESGQPQPSTTAAAPTQPELQAATLQKEPGQPETPKGAPSASTSVIQPTGAAPTAESTSTRDNHTTAADDDVSIAHKKVIQPPVEPIASQPDLNELLAKEGITNLDETHSGDPSAQPSSPHQPGHVISPNGTPAGGTTFNADDPNNIAL